MIFASTLSVCWVQSHWAQSTVLGLNQFWGRTSLAICPVLHLIFPQNSSNLNCACSLSAKICDLLRFCFGSWTPCLQRDSPQRQGNPSTTTVPLLSLVWNTVPLSKATPFICYSKTADDKFISGLAFLLRFDFLFFSELEVAASGVWFAVWFPYGWPVSIPN